MSVSLSNRFAFAALAMLIIAGALPQAPAYAVRQSPHPLTAPVKAIWSGSVGSFRWAWTTSDLAARSASTGRRVFSAATYEKLANPAVKQENDDPYDGYLECTIQPLSIVGSLVSYERDYYWEGGAHPSGSIDYVTLDVTNPRHRLALTDLFSDSDVLRALLSDRIVHSALVRDHTSGTPRSTAQLVKMLQGKGFGGESDSQFGFEADLLQRFAFHHIEGDRVAVRLNVSWQTEIYRFSSTQIGLLLPIPARLRTALARASTNREGFLIPEAKKLGAHRATLLFTLGKQPK